MVELLPPELATAVYEALLLSATRSTCGIVAYGPRQGEIIDLQQYNTAGRVVWLGGDECCLVSHANLRLRWFMRRVCKRLREWIDREGWAGPSGGISTPLGMNLWPIFVVDPDPAGSVRRRSGADWDWKKGYVPAGRAAVAQWREEIGQFVVQIEELGCFEHEKLALINIADKLCGVSGCRLYYKTLPPVLGVLTMIRLPNVVHPILKLKLTLEPEQITRCAVWGGGNHYKLTSADCLHFSRTAEKEVEKNC